MKYPGPNLLAALSEIRSATQNAPQTLLAISLRYGGVAHLGLGPRHIFLVSSVKGVERVLQSNQHNYRGFAYSHDRLRPLLGNGLLTSEGETWRRHRRLTQGAFHKQRLASNTPYMAGTMEKYLARWEANPDPSFVVDIRAEMTLLTLHVVAEALLGTGIGEQAGVIRDELPQVMHHLVSDLLNPFRLPEWVSTPRSRAFHKALDAFDAVVQTIIQEHRRSSETGDLMGMLMNAHYAPGGTQLSDQELKDEVMTLLMAGHETCVNALTWGLYLLARNPEIQERLADEVHRVLGDRSPTFRDIGSLPVAANVFHEILRLYPPAWIMARDAIHDDEIDGWPIPTRSVVFISPYVNHRLPSSWEDPERFIPDRFAPETSRDRPHFAYYPFGGGQRQCLGKNFAQIEAKLALPMLVQRFQFSLTSEAANTAFAPIPDVTMLPWQPISLVVRKR